jgi:hypothetical protein
MKFYLIKYNINTVIQNQLLLLLIYPENKPSIYSEKREEENKQTSIF